MKLLTEKILLPATSGKKTIAQAKDVFSWIDLDFKEWGTDVKGKATKELAVSVYENDKDRTFKEMFTGDLDSLCLTQEQIIEFGRQAEVGWYFLLFKVASEFFVARVSRNADGNRGVNVNRFSDDHVWFAEFRGRVVVPQLALKSSDSEPLPLGNFFPCPHCGENILVEFKKEER